MMWQNVFRTLLILAQLYLTVLGSCMLIIHFYLHTQQNWLCILYSTCDLHYNYMYFVAHAVTSSNDNSLYIIIGAIVAGLMLVAVAIIVVIIMVLCHRGTMSSRQKQIR